MNCLKSSLVMGLMAFSVCAFTKDFTVLKEAKNPLDLKTNNKSEANWTFTRKLSNGTRGGTSIGPKVQYDEQATESFKKIHEPHLSKFEKDRRAILALQGEFETSFEFLETILLDAKKNNKKLDRPYASKATELVTVVEDKGDYIALQHIIVMFIIDPKTNEVQGPMITKHWRQDWTYQGNKQLEFQGDKRFKVKTLNDEDVQGKWMWTVYQVDDSPRYSGIGQWNHFSSASTYETGFLSRPLPRREFSVRDDYKLLLGKDTLILTENSWYHEQRNFKHEETLNKKTSAFLAREIGQNSYKRIKNFNFQSGYNYLEKTEPFWAQVRIVWSDILKAHSAFKLNTVVNKKALFAVLFEMATNDDVLKKSADEKKALIKKTLYQYITK